MKCDPFVRQSMFGSIVLSGGSTLFEGLAERLCYEMSMLAAKEKTEIFVNAPPERKYSVWLGGSILASLSTFQSQWITK